MEDCIYLTVGQVQTLARLAEQAPRGLQVSGNAHSDTDVFVAAVINRPLDGHPELSGAVIHPDGSGAPKGLLA